MKYFIDTEFHEYHKQVKICGIPVYKPIPTIDLISIGIVAEYGREYYAISKDFNLKDAWNSFQIEQASGDGRNIYPEGMKVYWLRENVLRPIWNEFCEKGFSFKDSPMTPFGIETLFTYKNFKKLIKSKGKSNKQIAKEVAEFCNCSCIFSEKGEMSCESNDKFYSKPDTEFYGYYADYDWVVFAQLFGKMIDLPTGFPIYCKDLKQELDTVVSTKQIVVRNKTDGFGQRTNFVGDLYGTTFEKMLKIIKDDPNYPKQTNEHNALDDARWNKKLYRFLINL